LRNDRSAGLPRLADAWRRRRPGAFIFGNDSLPRPAYFLQITADMPEVGCKTNLGLNMKQIGLALSTALLTLVAFAAPQRASATDTNLTPEQVEANYTRAIEGRTADILKVLELSDTNRSTGVHDIILAQYRALRAWHDANGPELKAAKDDTNVVARIRSSLKSLHDEFIAKLSANLTPDQVESVKDKMTYGKVQFTYAGYLAAYPDLPEPQKQRILELLKEAREQAMDAGSADEKTAIFQRYKGKINNYLSKQGIQPAKKKPAKTSASTNSTPQQ
jgi:hypothetical protein